MSAPDPAPSTSGGVVDALALIAAGELASFARLADDAAHAPDLRTRIVLSRMAAGDLAPLDRVESHARELGVEADAFDAVVWDFRDLLSDFDARTVPRDWWERLIRTYIGYGLIADLQREIVANLTGETAVVVAEALADNGHGDYVVATLAPVIEAEPQLAARLALWGRRIVGEGLGVASRLLGGHEGLAALAGVSAPAGTAGSDGLSPLLGRLTGEHARRMKRLNLTA